MLRARAGLFAAITQARESAPDALCGVAFVRAQRLRELEWAHGYGATAQVHAGVRQALTTALRPGDLLFEIGECDFATVLPALRNRNHAGLAAAKLARVVQMPVLVDGQEVRLPYAVGAAVAPEDGEDPETLCKHADQACASAAGTADRHALYAGGEIAVPVPHEALRMAIAGNRLELALQPILDLRTGRLDRCEALSRWNHPDAGAIGPDVFVRVAEQTGLIGELTRWSLNVALRNLSALPRELRPVVSVNVAVDALEQPDFVEQVQQLLRFWNVDPAHLMVEVTESGIMRDLPGSERRLSRLRDGGIGVAIDDFGTGYSSMAYLRRLPASELKIDKSFVRDMYGDPRAAKLVASMIDVSHHLGMHTVAEGVEDAETLELLRALGCEYAQGYHIARPAPAANVLATLAQGLAAP